MSVRYSITTADYLEWSEMTTLVRALYRDENYTMSLLIAVGSFWGLRISDLRNLTWDDIMNKETLIIIEQKTDKRRTIAINLQLQRHIRACYTSLGEPALSQYILTSKMGTVMTIQRINVIFKGLKCKYHLHIDNFSTHSMRKTFGRQILNLAGANSEMALIKLSEIFGHSSTAITRKYLGLRQEEIMDTYNSLSF